MFTPSFFKPCSSSYASPGEPVSISTGCSPNTTCTLDSGGTAEDGADRFAVGEHDALVALGCLREVLLRDRPARAGLIDRHRRFHDRARVHVAVADHEDAEAAVAVDGFDHDGAALLLLERAQAIDRARDDRRWRKLGKPQNREVLVELAQAARVVAEQRLAARVL